MTKRVVLAYSGGLDTSVAIRWMIEEWGVEVVAVLVDVGQDVEGAESFEDIRARALVAGALDFVLVDARDEMAEEFCARPSPRTRATRTNIRSSRRCRVR